MQQRGLTQRWACRTGQLPAPALTCTSQPGHNQSPVGTLGRGVGALLYQLISVSLLQFASSVAMCTATVCQSQLR